VSDGDGCSAVGSVVFFGGGDFDRVTNLIDWLGKWPPRCHFSPSRTNIRRTTSMLVASKEILNIPFVSAPLLNFLYREAL